MKNVIVMAILLAMPAFGQSKEKEALLSKEAALELENLGLRQKQAEELLQKLASLVLGPIQSRQNAIVGDACKTAGIDIARCVVDTERGIVKEKPADSAAKPAK